MKQLDTIKDCFNLEFLYQLTLKDWAKMSKYPFQKAKGKVEDKFRKFLTNLYFTLPISMPITPSFLLGPFLQLISKKYQLFSVLSLRLDAKEFLGLEVKHGRRRSKVMILKKSRLRVS